MPTIFTHAVTAGALGLLFARRPVPARFWVLAAVCAMLPDADVVAFAFGIPYRSVLGHRGITHSLAFAIVVGSAVAWFGFRDREVGANRLALALFFSVVTASHGLLDALTDGGLGVAFFAPFDATRHFLPWRPIEVSPIGPSFFGARGAAVFASEIVWIWLPSAVVAAVGLVRRRGGAGGGVGE